MKKKDQTLHRKYYITLVIVLTKAAPAFNIMECRISPEVKLCTGNDLLCFQTVFCYLAGLVILNKFWKTQADSFFLQILSMC